jgi:hypothetical protein
LRRGRAAAAGFAMVFLILLQLPSVPRAGTAQLFERSAPHIGGGLEDGP